MGIVTRRVLSGSMGIAALVGTLVSCRPDPIRSTLERPVDPVVVTASRVPSLVGAPVGRIVAFRASSAGWTQLPVQVDERKDTTMAVVYDLPLDQFPATSLDVPVNVYADVGTFVGADSDPNLDADDEIAFMARDAGGPAGSLAAPPGTTGAGVELRLADPDVADNVGYVYLYRSTGSLDPGAGKQYVAYNFNLLSGDYKTTYERLDGPNPENSSVTGATYTTHFSDRWLLDRLTVTHGDRPAVDLVDRVKYRFPGTCIRNEDTFDNGEGAFIVNRVGPVRALRSYVGANSGPNTQATHAFYDMAIETNIDLRVHGIPGVGATLDWNQQAFGMTYRNPQVPNGVPVDGNPESVGTAAPSWWTMTGPQGGVGMAASMSTNLSVTPQTFYEDDLTPSTQCSGDGQAVADSGAFFTTPVACTDPGQGCTGRLRSRFWVVATLAGLPPASIQRYAEQGLRPLTVTASVR